MKTYTFDIETYINYTLFAFKNVKSGKLKLFELRGEDKSLTDKQKSKINKILDQNLIISFNGIKFDEPITAYALKGKTSKEIKQAVEAIIVDRMPLHAFYKQARVMRGLIKNHIDLIDVARGVASLKLYGARLSTRKLQDLPYPPEQVLSEIEMDEVRDYCGNDLVLTQELYEYLKTDIDLRTDITEKYGINVMSFNGAKIAEAILIHDTGFTGSVPETPDYVSLQLPRYIKFKTPELKALLKKIKKHKFLLMTDNILPLLREYKLEDEYSFLLDDLGIKKTTKQRHGSKTKKIISNSRTIIAPDFLDAPIILDGLSHKLGLGGVHGSVESTTFTPKDDETLLDIDYKSLYPSLKIQNKYIPKHIGDEYLKVYGGMYHTRNNVLKPQLKSLAYGSDEYNEVYKEQDIMKLVLNSSFGKEGEKYSKLFDPSSLLHTTVTGQLTLMMVVEMLHLKGFKTFYSNTDGITLLVKTKDVALIKDMTKKFDSITGLEMEYNEFKSCHIRDVNNFINITDDGKVKSKGAYGEPSIEKNSQTPIVYEAVRLFLQNGKSITNTINNCKDVAQFCTSKTVRGGAMFGTDIPKLVPERWEESLKRNGRVTKVILKEQDKMIANWVKDNGVYLGKVVRWYYSTKGSSIHYKSNGNLVGKSEGAIPMMDLPKDNKIPKDLNYNWYINEAHEVLKDLGVH